MSVTDPIADMLTRIRNSNRVKQEKVDIPSSKLKQEIARVLKEEGYITNYKNIVDRKQGILRVYLKYGAEKKNIITGIKRASKGSLRMYASKDRIPRIFRGLGIAIISTSRGVMTDRQCRKSKLGGEVLCYVW
ncbi:MAG: 30S ribosomal protein S8 [bacterium]